MTTGEKSFDGLKAVSDIPRTDHQAAQVREQQRVAIRRALGDEFRADVAVGTRPFSTTTGGPGLGQFRADLAREDVRSAARGVGHDDSDRLVRELLGLRWQCSRKDRAAKAAAMATTQCCVSFFSPPWPMVAERGM